MPEFRRVSVTLLITVMFYGFVSQNSVAQTAASQINLEGRWQVAFDLDGARKSLIFDSKAGGSGSFVLINDEKQREASLPAVWSRIDQDRVSFSGDAELPIGTCCVEFGTVVFKGRFKSNSSIFGKVVFITTVDDEESPLKLRSAIGTFTATRIDDRR